jgi:hypothetical protein
MPLLTPDKSLRLIIEIVFMLLGGLMIWIGQTGHFRYNSNPQGPGWLILSIAFLVWGARALYRPGKYWSRWEDWARGLSLVLVGVIMLFISRVPVLWVGRLLAIAGGLLLLRGLAGSVLVFRPK